MKTANTSFTIRRHWHDIQSKTPCFALFKVLSREGHKGRIDPQMKQRLLVGIT